ncbi:metallophosphoesterase [Streptococcus agalactiae]|uniref:metallophosphoesterase n=1 Tax=Streptococcus agalactiae TaxID=1311 RepID=UPI000A347AAC|nr:metallophosphoesterase [Streptococcus agalactiae]OTG44333.1 hypothetical protein B7936_07230 [Streptococcus agalactiae]OTG47873.1 hypothetical protein B7935_03570 [Streptococcus agalactiae]OTG50705.1 hypothetical protein B7932_07730 [Streptococcus agalactiae]OTG55595.1 hypothetical protein B7930_08500 [Streptococcus agalactiae]RRA75881.1 metallophosphoesterase [Streptococcus agalactiae]
MKCRVKKYAIIIIILSIVFIILGLNNNIVKTKYIIEDKRVQSNFKVIFIADTHSCSYGENQRELLDKVSEEKPDLILLGGDIIDDKLPMKVGLSTIKSLREYAPTYYVTGNHEIWSGRHEMIKEKIKNLDIEVLEGNKDTLKIKGNEMVIAGIDDPDIGEEYYIQLENLKKLKSDKITFLLAHRPEKIDDYRKIDIDYVFSGHAHGGQWRIPLILEKGLYAPNQGIFPKYTVGINKFDKFSLIVSRGLSRESTRIPRFFNPPEIVIVNFKKGK